jgi:cysteinyl-tRNA synthetase
MVEGEKMSKSKGTFYTVRDILTGNFKKDDQGNLWGRPVDPAVLRFELLKSHYRSNLNFTAKSVVDSAGSVRRLQEFRAALEERSGGHSDVVDLSHPIVHKFAQALADDLNIAGALGVVLPWAASKPENAAEALGALKLINSVLNVAPLNEGLDASDVSQQEDAGEINLQQAEQMCKELDEARANKDFDNADRLRQQLNDAGFEVRTTKEGTTIQKQLV